MASKINSRQKGARGERELARIFTEAGFLARRGQQFSGSPDSPDIVVDTSLSKLFHFEAKFVERLNLQDAIAQATRDAGNKAPVVIHRKARTDWLATLRLSDFLILLQVMKEKTEKAQ